MKIYPKSFDTNEIGLQFQNAQSFKLFEHTEQVAYSNSKSQENLSTYLHISYTTHYISFHKMERSVFRVQPEWGGW